jgi:hypothetical protein
MPLARAFLFRVMDDRYKFRFAFGTPLAPGAALRPCPWRERFLFRVLDERYKSQMQQIVRRLGIISFAVSLSARSRPPEPGRSFLEVIPLIPTGHHYAGQFEHAQGVSFPVVIVSRVK